MRTILTATSLALLLAGCAAGPDYAGPAQMAGASAPGQAFVRNGGEVQGAEPSLARWWTALGDPVLNDLELRALAANPGLAAAQARVRQARSSVLLEQANRLPQLGATGIYAHAQLPGVDLGSGSQSASTALDFFNLGLSANWEIDFAGGQRRTVEAANAQAQATEASAADAQVQLTAEVAQAYVNLRERQQRLALLGAQRGLQQQGIALAQQRFDAGTAPAALVEQARIAAERTGADIAAATVERDVYLNALAVLTGSVPGALDADLAAVAPVPLPPASVAVGDPGSLVARRPDVRAAERAVAAATARIGVAEAARYPRISFMGILGLGGTSPADLTDLDNIAAIAMPQLQWSFLDFGRNRARVGQAAAAHDEAEAKYRQSVLGALRDTEDALSRFGRQRELVAALARIAASSERMSSLAQQRFAAGVGTRTDSLEAQRQALVAQQNLQTATAVLTGAYVAVNKALGLGWEAPVQP